jgi:isopenicillin-N N-acyltransferase-like protein
MRVLEASGSPTAIGRAHGEAFGQDIRSYMHDRRELSLLGTSLSAAEVTQIAEDMLDAHRDYDLDLFDEMVAMAQAANISPAEAIIVGGYTDFIDTVRAVADGEAMEDTCTATITPDALSHGSGFLAQTWDMHASATPHVFMFDVHPDGAPRALAFTTHGTVGQIGMNEAGIAIGINNLTMLDGGVGVTWPFVVRKVLRQTTFDEAFACIVDANLAGGHNFLLRDDQGKGVSVEATTTQTAVNELGNTPLVHTNHCVFANTKAVEAPRPAGLNANSLKRMSDATRLLGNSGTHTADSLMTLLRDENSICRHPEPPLNHESSGAVIMRPGTRDMWAAWGIPSEADFEHFDV